MTFSFSFYERKVPVLMIENRPGYGLHSHAMLWWVLLWLPLPSVDGMVAFKPHPASACVSAISFFCGLVMRVVSTWKTVLLKSREMALERLFFFDDAELVGDWRWEFLWKIAFSVLVCYAIVCFRFHSKTFFFGSFLWRLMPSVEVDVPIMRCGEILIYFKLTGLTAWPLIASAIGNVFCSASAFWSIPGECGEAARMEWAGRWRFFVDICCPLSRTILRHCFDLVHIWLE